MSTPNCVCSIMQISSEEIHKFLFMAECLNVRISLALFHAQHRKQKTELELVFQVWLFQAALAADSRIIIVTTLAKR